MPKFVLFLLLLAGAQLGLQAQSDSAVVRSLVASPEQLGELTPGPLLDATQLEAKPLFTELGAALADPANVYKLSLVDSRLREVPAEIFRLVNLQYLNLGENKIRILPDEMAKLTNLQTLVLTNNKLRVLPESMKDLENLRRLYLGENKIKEMPAFVGGLSYLRYLDLHGNYVTLYDIKRTQYMLPRCEINY